MSENTTQGPWTARDCGDVCCNWVESPEGEYVAGVASPEEANFIAAALTLVPELVAEAERLTAENAELRARIERVEKLRDHYRDRLPDGTGNGRAVNAHRVWHDIDAALDGEQS